ncbi:hypothetical protein C9374_007852 [Naegleria lovaniensis]|uniref:Uncharacterized protein n=1 Tax=Naegleria lovaniensis TaxID=51637 RepID=A0AA88KLB3_NAELO|nr:uncharacterized protein C9374_007852 [Naegleria lovaniensis]KAG2378704.1 hypothetical protein C9374_007852 [Naegleria lovaniensis]
MSTEYFITLNGGLNEGEMNSTYSMKVSNTLTLEEWLVAVIVIAALVGAFAVGTALLLGVILISKLSSKTNTQSATTCSSSKNVSISQQELNSNKQNGPFWEPTGNEEQSGMIA